MRIAVLMMMLFYSACTQPQDPTIISIVDSALIEEYVQRIDSLQQVIERYEQEKFLKPLEGGIVSSDKTDLLEDLRRASMQLSSPTGKYFIFFSISVVKTDFNTGRREETFVSKIHELRNINEEIEFKLLDDFQESIYIKSGEKVTNRKTYYYYTYREASKHRNELLY